MRKSIFIVFVGVLFFLCFTKVFAKGAVEEDLAGEYFSIAQGYTELKTILRLQIIILKPKSLKNIKMQLNIIWHKFMLFKMNGKAA